jgi:hypothetical protein
MVNRQLYQEVQACLREAVCRKRPELWENQTSMLHHDNALDLAPADFFLFPKLKTTLKGHCFQTIEEIQENTVRELHAITESVFQEAFEEWKKHWELYITSRGDCFEGGSA